MSMTVEAYLALFNYVRQIAPTFHPERIHCDFEKAQMRAFRMVFPNAAIVGCLWHFGVVRYVVFVVHCMFMSCNGCDCGPCFDAPSGLQWAGKETGLGWLSCRGRGGLLVHPVPLRCSPSSCGHHVAGCPADLGGGGRSQLGGGAETSLPVLSQGVASSNERVICLGPSGEDQQLL